MYDTLVNLIQYGDYTLSEITERIDTMYAECRITAAQRGDLQRMVLDYITPPTPEVPEQIKYLAEEIEALKSRVTALEGGGEQPDEDKPSETVEEWVQPIAGLTDKYQYGAVVSHGGKVWRSTFARGQNVWEPGLIGTELYWQEVTA